MIWVISPQTLRLSSPGEPGRRWVGGGRCRLSPVLPLLCLTICCRDRTSHHDLQDTRALHHDLEDTCVLRGGLQDTRALR
ncbi:hypothetical protein E2C01_097332 [Portunus trituberculatus]|uniref:Uncharacterized protein n=1 Tax=Portunus trituberculatus TaxID=210409 RepID=A0A5B7K5F4_PORTR|nr:hypothetical protein [Portunus trituberculatus]